LTDRDVEFIGGEILGCDLLFTSSTKYFFSHSDPERGEYGESILRGVCGKKGGIYLFL